MKKSDPPSGFKIKGVPLALTREPVAVRRLRAKLDAMKTGELVKTCDAAALAGVTTNTFGAHLANEHSLAPYRAFARPRLLVWGNPQTIQKLQRRLRELQRRLQRTSTK